MYPKKVTIKVLRLHRVNNSVTLVTFTCSEWREKKEHHLLIYNSHILCEERATRDTSYPILEYDKYFDAENTWIYL